MWSAELGICMAAGLGICRLQGHGRGFVQIQIQIQNPDAVSFYQSWKQKSIILNNFLVERLQFCNMLKRIVKFKLFV